MNIPNLVLWHTEGKNLAYRKKTCTAEEQEYYHGNLFVPDDEEVLFF